MANIALSAHTGVIGLIIKAQIEADKTYNRSSCKIKPITKGMIQKAVVTTLARNQASQPILVVNICFSSSLSFFSDTNKRCIRDTTLFSGYKQSITYIEFILI
jgi:hypothetical protein